MHWLSALPRIALYNCREVKRIVIRTKRELKIVRAHLRQRRLRRLHRWFERWTIPILWAILLLATGLFVTYVYILPMHRIANEGFGFGLYGPQTYESILKAITARVGDPVYEGADTEWVSDFWGFTTIQQCITVCRKPRDVTYMEVFPLEGLDIEPGTASLVRTDKGITIGSSLADAYHAYGSFGIDDALEASVILRSKAARESSERYEMTYYSITGAHYRYTALVFESNKLVKIKLAIVPIKPYYERLWLYYSSFFDAPHSIEAVVLASTVVPFHILLFFLSYGVKVYRSRLWLLWLFGLAPYAVTYLWFWSYQDWLTGDSFGPIPTALAAAAIPLLTGIYVATTLGFRVWRKPAGIDIPILSHIDNWMSYPAALIKGGVCAIIVAILVVLCSIPAALFITALLPF